MKLIICAEDRKREIDTSFSLCASAGDFQVIIDQLQTALRNGFTYGWVDIHASPIKQVVNSAPEPWNS